MFDFGNANDGQRSAISASDGAVLITAGPGTGKTYTLVQRAIYLIQECGVKPEQILKSNQNEKVAISALTQICDTLSVDIGDIIENTYHAVKVTKQEEI